MEKIMSFIGRLIDKDKVKELTDKYKLIRPGFDDGHPLDSHMVAMAYSKKDDAICVSVQSQQGVSLNGQLPAGGIPRINTLIWKGFNIRIDLYESFMGLNVEKFNNGHEQVKEFMLIAKRIIAPIELKSEKEKIAQLAEEGSLALHQVTLLPRDSQKKSIFKGIDITFMNKDEIWKL